MGQFVEVVARNDPTNEPYPNYVPFLGRFCFMKIDKNSVYIQLGSEKNYVLSTL